MIARLWQTGVDPARLGEYETFARRDSFPMFERRAGCAGLLLLRSEAHGVVVSLWDDAEQITSLEASESYRATVERITASGLLTGRQSVRVYNVHGGFLRVDALRELSAGDTQ